MSPQPFEAGALGSKLVREVAELPEEVPVPQPYMEFCHFLYVYPTMLDLSRYSGKLSARTLGMPVSKLPLRAV